MDTPRDSPRKANVLEHQAHNSTENLCDYYAKRIVVVHLCSVLLACLCDVSYSNTTGVSSQYFHFQIVGVPCAIFIFDIGLIRERYLAPFSFF